MKPARLEDGRGSTSENHPAKAQFLWRDWHLLLKMLRSIRLDANGDAKPVRHVTGEFCIEHLIWHREYAAVQFFTTRFGPTPSFSASISTVIP
jgi:hypothetical protein